MSLVEQLRFNFKYSQAFKVNTSKQYNIVY